MRGEFYKMEYEAWDEGTELLTLEQEGAYLRFCHQMYRRRGPVIDDAGVLARIWKCHPNKARKLRDDLIAAGKIMVTSDGYLANNRVTQELDQRDTTRTQRAHAGKTGGIRSGEIRRNPLKNKDQDEAFASVATNESREEKSREDSPLNPPLDALPLGLPPHPSDEGLKAASGRKEGASRGSRLPSDWRLSDEGRAYATAKGLSAGRIEREAERFRDFWLAKTGKDAVKADWGATWRNWVLRVVDRGDLTLAPPTTAAPTVRYFDN